MILTRIYNVLKRLKRRAVQLYHRFLVLRSLSFVKQACPLCGNNDRFETLFTTDRYNLPITTARCEQCDLIMQHPMPTQEFLDMFYSSGMYRGLYHGIFSPPRKRGNDKGFKKARANRAFVEKYVTLPEDAEILDFGSADGTTLLEFKEAYPKWHAYGLEPGSNLASLNQHLLDGFYNTPNDIPKEQKFDLIMMTHVLEHLFSPIDVLMELATHLKQDGTLVLEVPDFNQYTGSLRTIHIAHLYHFTDKTIEKLAKKAGLEVALITQDRRALDNHGMRVMLKKAAPKKS